MTKVKGSITHRKARINVESDLLVSNTDQLNISSPPAIHSISFSLEKIANTGVLFTKGTTVVNVSDIGSNLNAKSQVVINSDGFIWIDGNKGASHTFDFTVAGDFIVGNGGANNEDFKIQHLCFYGNSRSLTQLECSELYRKVGKIPNSLHGNDLIIGHWPLTERYAYDNGVDNVFFDVIEQYNYAKATPLGANHAKAINYTDDELGLSNDDTDTVKKNFYNKNALSFAYSRFNGTDSNISIPHASNLTFGDGGTDGMGNVSFAITAHFIPYANASRIFEKGQEFSIAGRQYIVTVNAAGTLQFKIFTNAGVVQLGSHTVTFGKQYFVSAGYDNNASDIRLGMSLMLWEDGVLVENVVGLSAPTHTDIVDSTTTQLIGAGDNTHADADIADVRIHNKPLSYLEALKVKRGEDSGFEISGWLLNGKPTVQNATTVDDVFGGGNNGTTTNIIRGFELSSVLPELREAFGFDGGTGHFLDENPSIAYDANGFYTIMLAFKMPNATFQDGTKDVFVYYRTLDNVERFRVQGNNLDDRIGVVFGNQTVTLAFNLNLQQLNVLFIQFDSNNNIFLHDSVGNLLFSQNSSNVVIPRFDLMQEVYYGRNALDAASSPRFLGNYVKYAIWNRKLTPLEMIKESNNTLLFPHTSNKSGLQDMVTFQEGYFSENGVNVLMKNQITGFEIKAQEFAGATTADQLTDAINHLSLINSLR